MRLIGAASVVFLLTLTSVVFPSAQGNPAFQRAHDVRGVKAGQQIFRFDTFGDEQLWTDVLRMHEVIRDGRSGDGAGGRPEGRRRGAAGGGHRGAARRRGRSDRSRRDASTLLRLNAVVGVKGTVNDAGQLTDGRHHVRAVPFDVDDSFAPGIGKRLDGWANTDLDVGAIVALSPALDEATKAEFNAWGPGKYDPRHHAFDGTNIIPLNSPSVPIVIPPIYGLRAWGSRRSPATDRSPTGTATSAWGRWAARARSAIRGSACSSTRRPTSSRRSCRRCSTISSVCGRRSRRRAASIAGRRARPASVPQRGAVRIVPSGSDLHRRAERPRPARAAPARSGRGRHGPDVRGPIAPPDSTGRRRCAACCSIRRTSTMAARPTCWPSSSTTTSSSG